MEPDAVETRTPGPQRLSLAARERLRAVVFDANAYGKGLPDLGNLARLADRLHAAGIETWVPEVVAWEWAQHLAREWRTVCGLGSSQRKALRVGGVPIPEPDVHFVDELALIDKFVHNLAATPSLRVLAASPTNALEGLKDQILQRAPGKLKSEVKTGASDSAWIRDVLDAADHDITSILFVTADRDIAAAFRAWDLSQPAMCKRTDLGTVLFDTKFDDGSATRTIVRYLLAMLPASLAPTSAFDVGEIPDLSKTIEAEVDDPTVTVIAANVLNATALVGLLDDVTIISASGADFGAPADARGEPGPPRHVDAVATVFLLADVEAWSHRDFGDSDHPTLDRGLYRDVLLKARLSFRFTDGRITGVSPEGDAVIFMPTTDFLSFSDATIELADAMSMVPGLEFEALLSEEPHEFVLQGNKPAVLSMNINYDDEEASWMLSIERENGTETVEVDGVYDSSAWAGGSDGSHYFPPYAVTTFSDGLSMANPIWSVPAWIIRQLDWDPKLTP